VAGLRHVVLILVKSSAAQGFDAPAVYAVNKKEAAVAIPRAGGARMEITGEY
jgi:hypothetical protein